MRFRLRELLFATVIVAAYCFALSYVRSLRSSDMLLATVPIGLFVALLVITTRVLREAAVGHGVRRQSFPRLMPHVVISVGYVAVTACHALWPVMPLLMGCVLLPAILPVSHVFIAELANEADNVTSDTSAGRLRRRPLPPPRRRRRRGPIAG